jgi:hypothetical protein
LLQSNPKSVQGRPRFERPRIGRGLAGRLDHIDPQHGIEKILGLQDHSVVDIGMLQDGRMN